MRLLRIGITHGDINGISYELLLKVLQDMELLDLCTPIIFGCQQVAHFTARQLELPEISFNIIKNPSEALEGRYNMVNVCGNTIPDVEFGQQTEAALQAEANSLTAALEAYRNHQIDVLVTLPGHLDNDQESHALSDFIRRALGLPDTGTFDWIINRELRLLRLHPLDVSTQLGEGLASEAFITDLTLINNALRRDFGLIKGRISVIAKPERIADDITELQEDGIFVFGPFESKVFTDHAAYNRYDANLYLDEDEALSQALSQADADYTIGYVSNLPLILTYPLQGICYDIAGKGQATEIPLREAIYTAIDIFRSRRTYEHATRSPLEKHWNPRGRDDFKLDLTKED